MVTTKHVVKGLLASAGVLSLGVSLARADDAAYLEKAKAYLANVAAPVTKWDGPTTGPKNVGKKLIVIVSTDGRTWPVGSPRDLFRPDGTVDTSRWIAALHPNVLAQLPPDPALDPSSSPPAQLPQHGIVRIVEDPVLTFDPG